MKRAVTLGLLLFAVWILWSGLSWPWARDYEPLLLWMGVLSTTFVVFLAARMKIIDSEGVPVELTNFRLLGYVPWLAWEIAKANADVVRRILHPSLPISPTLIRVRASQRSEIGQVVYANSITLTPGTVSVDVEDGSITVHALSRDAADGVETGEMDRRVAHLEGAS